ncbi:hypothetical protein DPMN_143604 [Dreissena polymorpha]|uniref:Uncharacterized protein n=1 Tax=Dreissena polymorpha TaxID=45954 RepID=A0A9D4GHE3_DREPO|nr:hypothetical protein DPMN_143604 [Dreissena polymorpha]
MSTSRPKDPLDLETPLGAYMVISHRTRITWAVVDSARYRRQPVLETTLCILVPDE